MRTGLFTLMVLALFPLTSIAAVCSERTHKEQDDFTHLRCTNPDIHPNRHKESILRLVAIRDALVEDVLKRDESSKIAYSLKPGGETHGSRLPIETCTQILYDILHLQNIEVVSQ